MKTNNDYPRLFVIALAYFFAFFISFLFPDTQNILMAVWPASGVGLAALLLSPRRLWPSIALVLFIAGNAADLFQHRLYINNLGFMTANVMESWGCAWLISRICGQRIRFERVKDVLALILAATMVNACSACLGAGIATLTSGTAFGHNWLIWWVADGLGILIVTPLIVTWSDGCSFLTDMRWKKQVEWGAFLIFWCVVSVIPFYDRPFLQNHYILPYMLVTLIAWPAIRFGQRGVATAIILLEIILIASPAVIIGPLRWGGLTLADRLLQAQIFLGFIGISGMLLAASYTELKRSEKAMRESEERFSKIFRVNPIGVAFSRVSDDQFVDANDAFTKIFGYTHEEIVGHTSNELGFWPFRDERDRFVLEVRKHNKPKGIEARFRQKSGEMGDLLISMELINLDGEEHLLGFVLDITQRKQVEEEVRQLNLSLERRVNERTQQIARQNTKLQELYSELAHMSRIAVLGQLSAVLAHEINQPLGAILNRASTAKILLSQGKPDISQVQKILSHIIDEDERAGRVIQNLREMIKKEPSENEKLDMDQVIRDITTLIESRFILKDVTMALDIQPGEKIILGNKVQLQQVMLNLISNALEALSEAPLKKIMIRTALQDPQWVAVSVINSGLKIDMDDLENLFKPFYTTKKEGLGMGLFICRSIIQAHGGQLSAHNNPDEGVTFLFSLPILKETVDQ